MSKEGLLTVGKGISPRYLIALYLVSVIAVGIIVSSILLYPQEQRYNELARQLQQERQKVAVVENFVLAHPNVEQYLTDLQQSMNRAEKALPGTMEISAFLSQLEKDARTSGVKLSNVKPSAVANREGYREMPVELTVEGPFFATMSFVKRVEDGDRFTVPTGFMIQQKPNLLTTRLNLQIFSFGGAPPQPGAPGAQKPPAK